jgi:organic hydroperoxide reductase OsmC/OhrA
MAQHQYHTTVKWTGNLGKGTTAYNAYQRSHTISVDKKVIIEGSADPAFRGDPGKHNPEELFLASIAGCHMLWYLHLCAVNGVVVESYLDKAKGVMETKADGSGRFTEITLAPDIIVTDESMLRVALQQHEKAHEMCFLASSVNFPIHIVPNIKSI